MRNLDKARRLSGPIKQKYGQKISWADLLVLTATSPSSRWVQDVRLRLRAPRIWEPEEILWGAEDTWLGDARYSGDRELAKHRRRADGLIYVNRRAQRQTDPLLPRATSARPSPAWRLTTRRRLPSSSAATVSARHHGAATGGPGT